MNLEQWNEGDLDFERKEGRKKRRKKKRKRFRIYEFGRIEEKNKKISNLRIWTMERRKEGDLEFGRKEGKKKGRNLEFMNLER